MIDLAGKRFGDLIKVAREAGTAYRRAAAVARYAGRQTEATRLDGMAAYQEWRAEQIDLFRQGQRRGMPTYGEWQDQARARSGQATFF